ncbi:radical SAM protein [Spirochaetia bacterium]|nr:radical SAM protein [Spirochaetia bacterium]
MTKCFLCPRRCGVDRETREKGFCGEDARLRIASASIHRGEEPPVTGEGGSGTIFVSGCNLGCVFCQNHQISGGGMGRPVDTAEFAAICLALQEKGAENINIVTGSHAVPAIVEGIRAAREKGLHLPVLWNSSAYESTEALALLQDTVDKYLPDLKTLDVAIAEKFFHAPDYPEHAAAAIEKMMEYRPPADGTKRVIIRHLMIPGYPESTRQVLRWFAGRTKGKALLSLMTQYTPVNQQGPGRFINQGEYETALGWLEEFDIEDGFYQELEPSSDWLPDFRRTNPFSSALSRPVWHWKDGFAGSGGPTRSGA